MDYISGPNLRISNTVQIVAPGRCAQHPRHRMQHAGFSRAPRRRFKCTEPGDLYLHMEQPKWILISHSAPGYCCSVFPYGASMSYLSSTGRDITPQQRTAGHVPECQVAAWPSPHIAAATEPADPTELNSSSAFTLFPTKVPLYTSWQRASLAIM